MTMTGHWILLTAHLNPFFFRASALYLLVFIGILMLLPTAIALQDSPSGNSDVNNPSIGIELDTPRENQAFSVDVVPPHIWVAGQVNTTVPIQSIIVSSSAGTVDCGSSSSFGCTVPVLKGSDTITVTVSDVNGNVAGATREISVRSGGPVQPIRITIAGKITDPDGQPVAGAIIRLASESWPASTESESDGSYRISNAYGNNQTIVIEKDGYIPVSTTIVFNQNVNSADFTLEPAMKPSPGFEGFFCILAILISVVLLSAYTNMKRS